MKYKVVFIKEVEVDANSEKEAENLATSIARRMEDKVTIVKDITSYTKAEARVSVQFSKTMVALHKQIEMVTKDLFECRKKLK